MDYQKVKIKHILKHQETGRKILANGWVRTKRESKNVVFIALNDGSVLHNLQIVADPEKFDENLFKDITTGACLSVYGEVVESSGSGQNVELKAEKIDVLGKADPEKFPLQPKRHSLEFLREIAHLRPRTNTFSAVFRVRHAMTYAIHQFFHEKGFINVQTPVITASDAEGAGEMFRVTTLDINNPARTETGEIDHSMDFFERETNLTVSGQLEAELFALALTEVYTFGPTFRAENSNTTRHLAEFWMIEPEMAFYDLKDNMDLAEEFLKYIIQYVLDNCQEDIEFLNKRAIEEDKLKKLEERSDMTLIEHLHFVLENKFERITYTEAIDILRNSKPNKKKKFQFLIEEWGSDLQSEHERYLVEKHFKKPVILYDYPKEIKAFYMRQNDDGKTVRAMDILFPRLGEIVGGSQREERMDKLIQRMQECGISEKELWWYLDSRRFGTAPHSGFGLGFERFIQFVTGITNIRDVIPFPRARGSAEF
jgi:asparaginyl-tRNA synthetase